MKEFIERLMEEICIDCPMEFITKTVTNGNVQMGIRVIDNGVGMDLYLNELYESLNEGYIDFEEAKDYFQRQVEETMDWKPDFPEITKDLVRENVRLQVINRDSCSEYLKNKIHIPVVNDIDVIMAIQFDYEYRCVITPEILKHIGATAEEVYEWAKKNSSETATMTSLGGALFFEDEPENYLETGSLPENERAFLLMCHNGILGASVMCLREVLTKVRFILGGDFYIIPSSVHELIVIPESAMDRESIQKTLESGNELVVTPEELLSGKVIHSKELL